MSEQLELGLFPLSAMPQRITVDEAFSVLWKGHLSTKPSGRTYTPNRKALCRSFGRRYFDTLTDLDFQRHRESRLEGSDGRPAVGIGTVFHDHGLLSLLYAKIAYWKKRRAVVDGIDLSELALPIESPTKGIPKTKAQKRRRVISPDEFARLQEHADPDLRELFYVLTDTMVRLGDALRLRPEHYNPYTDQIEFIQHKTGKLQIIPPSWRVKKSFVKARRLGLPFVYSAVNLRARFEATLKAAKVSNVQLGRDFRKSGYNVGRRFCKDPEISRQHAGHTSSRTGDDHYYIEEREDLRPVVLHVEKIYK